MKKLPEELKAKSTIYTEHWRAKHPEQAAALVHRNNQRYIGKQLLERATRRSAYWRLGIIKRLHEGMDPVDIAFQLHVPLSIVNQVKAHGRTHLT